MKLRKVPCSLSVDDLSTTRRTIKEMLSKQSGKLKEQSLCECVIQTYRFRRKLRIDIGQVAIALRQLIAEGDVLVDAEGIHRLVAWK